MTDNADIRRMAATTKNPKELPLRDRIIDMRRIPARDLLQNPGNYRRHPQFQRDVLAGVLREIGIADTLVVYDSPRHGGMTIIDGHLRAADHTTEWPCAIVDLTDEEADYLLLVKDPLAALAETDASTHARTLRGVQSGEATVQQFLSEQAESYGGLDGENSDKELSEIVEDDPPDPTEELREKWGTELGQVWELRRHKVICGDCTDPSIEHIVQLGSCDILFTDPPYNCVENNIIYAKDAPIPKAYKKLSEQNWDINFNPIEALDICDKFLNENCTIYVCMSHHTAPDIWAWMKKTMNFYSYCVWSKPNPMPSLSKRHWTWASELIAYGTRGKHTFNAIEGSNALSVWNVSQHKSRESRHPTAKPVDLVAHALNFSSEKGALVYDPFMGSGTTLIAAEQTGRTVVGCEIDPKYAALVLQRWHDLTGETPKLISA